MYITYYILHISYHISHITYCKSHITHHITSSLKHDQHRSPCLYIMLIPQYSTHHPNTSHLPTSHHLLYHTHFKSITIPYHLFNTLQPYIYFYFYIYYTSSVYLPMYLLYIYQINHYLISSLQYI